MTIKLLKNQGQSKNSGAEFGAGLALSSVLIVDDEAGMRNFLTKTLGPRCRRVESASNVEQASELLDHIHFDIVILDNIMPGTTGLEWLKQQRKRGFFADTILITAFADFEIAITALRAGVTDFVLKPFRSNQILNAVARCFDRQELRRENYLLRHELSSDRLCAHGRLLGRSPEISSIRETLERIAPLPTSVLFTGASGTGKELVARTLHGMSDRAEHLFVPVNCAAISPEAIANELFGYISHDPVKGDCQQDGLLFHARGGTLFLDEIIELPLKVQGMLLRVIEDMRIRPIGSLREVPLDLRFMFATNADLESAVAEGRFRTDLFHRINVMNIKMPSLIQRKGDLVELSAMFMQRISDELGVKPLPLSEGVMLKLSSYDWPGNVRELRNLIERSLILGEFPPEFSDASQSTELAVDSLAAVEQRHILNVLGDCSGNRAEAARRLGCRAKP